MSFDAKSVADRAAIRDVLERYCRGIDRLDEELITSVYWKGAIDDHGLYKGPGEGFAAFIVPLLRDAYRATMHCLNQSLIQLKGNRANAETYFVAYHVGSKDGGEFIEIAGGRYVDVLEERNGEWRISDRVVVIEWARDDKGLAKAGLPIDKFVPPRRDRKDIAYGIR